MSVVTKKNTIFSFVGEEEREASENLLQVLRLNQQSSETQQEKATRQNEAVSKVMRLIRAR